MNHQEKEHVREIEQLKAKHALRESDNDVTKYRNEISSLEVRFYSLPVVYCIKNSVYCNIKNN